MIAEHPVSTKPEVDFNAIFEEQRRRYRAAPYPSLEARRANLDKLERGIRAYHDQLLDALKADFRKSADETEFTEFVVTLAELKFAHAKLATWMRPEGVETPLSLFGSKAEIRYEPKGVVLILAPWNYPFYLSIVPLIAALAAGNRVILRPSEKAPATRDVIAKLVGDAFPANEVAVVGGEVETAEALLKLPFDHIFFTGSTRVGKMVMRAAAEHLTSVTLELGGKSPVIVTEDADVKHAAGRIAWGKYMNGGQTCVAPDYVLVHESVQRKLLDSTAASIAKMYGATDEERAKTPDFCRMIDDGHFARISSLLTATVEGGAKVEVGGQTDASQRYIAPTVLSNVTFDAPIMQEEIFGPVLPVITYRSLEEALAQINARPKPLALYAFSTKAKVTEQILNGTSAGGTLFNDTILHLANPNLPFGGVGESGLGSYHGIFGFKAFSHERSIMRQTKASMAPMLAPPYNAKTRGMMKILEKLPG
jgi:aldehyde dehydrogenase (NAD+)